MPTRAALGVALVTAAAGLGSAAGCQSYELPEPEPPPELTVAVPQGRLCAGMAPWVDAEVQRVEDVLGLPLRRSLFVELGADAVTRACGGAEGNAVPLGCTVGTGQDVRVYARPEALAHELVHALRRQWELGTVAFLEEGWAEAITGSDVVPSIVEVDPRAVEDDVEAMLEASAEEMRDPWRRTIAAHVVRFMEDVAGAEALSAFFRGGTGEGAEGARVRIESMLGMSWTSWVTRWSAEAQPVKGRGDPCAITGVIDAGADGAALEAMVDCDGPGTFGIAGDDVGAWTRQCVRVMAAGPWTAELTADGGSVTLAAVPGTCEVDTPSTAMASREIEPGAAVTTMLGACTYTATFTVRDDVPTAMTLALQPDA